MLQQLESEATVGRIKPAMTWAARPARSTRHFAGPMPARTQTDALSVSIGPG